jgi:hypothetical protein
MGMLLTVMTSVVEASPAPLKARTVKERGRLSSWGVPDTTPVVTLNLSPSGRLAAGGSMLNLLICVSTMGTFGVIARSTSYIGEGSA